LALQEIVGKDGKVAGVNFQGVESITIDDLGRIIPTLMEGSRTFMETNCVIIAIGQLLDPSVLDGIKGLELNAKRNIAADPDTMATNLSGVFAGGDAVLGAGTVVEAIATGHRAASSIDKYLSGKDLKEVKVPREVVDVEDEQLPMFVERRERSKMPRASVKERVSSSKEIVDRGFSREAAINEAKRCLSCPVCGTCIYYRSQMCHETALRLL
jgi:formate dehydrogenase major subunit